jgi:hypothetical protein
VRVAGEALLASAVPVDFAALPGVGAGARGGAPRELALEALPNRDARPYATAYGLVLGSAECHSFFRGTLRYRGACETVPRRAPLPRHGCFTTRPRGAVPACARAACHAA